MVPKSERLRVLHLHMRAHASHDSCDDSSDAKYGMITTPHSTTQWLSNMLMLSYTVQSSAVGYREVLCTLLLYVMKFVVMISGTQQLVQDIQ